MVICLEDNTTHENIEALHKYLRKLKIKQEDYYLRFYPRKDLGTGEQIPYKDYLQYFSTEFLNKNNLKKFVKEKPEEAKEWAINWLKKRKEEKELVYAPCQVELRSLMSPSIPYFDKIGGYNKICAGLGYKIRYNQKFEEKLLPVGAELIVDTREQLPLNIKDTKTLVAKVDCGDYALNGEHDQGIYIERKGLSDFTGTLSKDLGRFKRELQRAKNSGSYIIVLVENNINDALGFNFLPQMRYTKATPAHIFKNVRDIMYEFDNVQFLFVKNRREAASAVSKLLAAGDQVKNIDLELAYELGELTF